MEINIEKHILQTIKKGNSVTSLFSLGFSYAQIFKWLYELEKNEMIYNKENIRMLTSKGESRLDNLNQKKTVVILPLNEYKKERKDIDEVYLP